MIGVINRRHNGVLTSGIARICCEEGQR